MIESRLAVSLRQAGYKLTPSRLAVLQVLEQGDPHLSRAEVLARAKDIYPALGRATVYRTLELLTQLGMVRPIYLGEQGACFTRADGAHHHLICTDCGRVTDFEDCVIDALQLALSQRHKFTIRGHLLEFYGVCEDCHE